MFGDQSHVLWCCNGKTAENHSFASNWIGQLMVLQWHPIPWDWSKFVWDWLDQCYGKMLEYIWWPVPCVVVLKWQNSQKTLICLSMDWTTDGAPVAPQTLGLIKICLRLVRTRLWQDVGACLVSTPLCCGVAMAKQLKNIHLPFTGLDNWWCSSGTPNPGTDQNLFGNG